MKEKVETTPPTKESRDDRIFHAAVKFLNHGTRPPPDLGEIKGNQFILTIINPQNN